MKIAVIAPSPVPFRIGGAERLWWNLVRHLNENTSHEAELVKLPAREHDLRALLASYEAFAQLDLAQFDLVISGKYPAWMVGHPRHVCYMLHPLRGLYDAYDGVADLPRAAAAEPHVTALHAFMARAEGQRGALPEFFARAREALAHAVHLPGVADFPGPFARALVHWLDRVGLSTRAIVRHAAISRTVARRAGYFPDDASVQVAWPPPAALAPGSAPGRYFFTASRLDGPKRVDLLIASMRHVRGDMPLWIAGDGPDRPRLEALATGDERIRFLGWQSEAALADLYAGARAVPFVPFAEDYGLVAAEAMHAGKAVITATDAGGPCELVADGETGFVCAPTAEALGAALDRLAHDDVLAARLGAASRARAATLTWDAVTAVLVPDDLAAHPPSRARRKIVVATTFGIDPPRHGGQSRVFHFYSNLYPQCETTVVSFGPAGSEPFAREIAPGLREVRVPKSDAHERHEAALQRDVAIPVADIAMPSLHTLTPDYAAALAREAADASCVVACHPYLFPALADLRVALWYEAQDLEADLKGDVLKQTAVGLRLLAEVVAVEGACARAAEAVLCTSAHDGNALVRQYGVDPKRIVVAPNGTDCSRLRYVDSAERADLKARLGLESRPFVLFVGSGHWPNIVALRWIARWAREMPDIVFVVVGSVCDGFAPPQPVPNLLYLGEVDDITRNLALEMCDVALNPMEHGSGTNLKMLDYFAAGIPVIATEIGARGTQARDGVECRIVALDDVPAALREVLALPPAARDAMTAEARRQVERHFDWAHIAKAALAALPSPVPSVSAGPPARD